MVRVLPWALSSQPLLKDGKSPTSKLVNNYKANISWIIGLKLRGNSKALVLLKRVVNVVYREIIGQTEGATTLQEFPYLSVGLILFSTGIYLSLFDSLYWAEPPFFYALPVNAATPSGCIPGRPAKIRVSKFLLPSINWNLKILQISWI